MLVRYDEGSFFQGGVGQTVEWSVPRWKLTIESVPLPLATLHELHAWWESLRGQMGTFLAYDFSNPYPRAYPSASYPLTRFDSSAFDGTCSCTAFGSGGYTISLSNLPAAFHLQPGDYFSLVESGKYAIHKVTEDNTAAGGGNIANMAITPRILTNVFSTSATVEFSKPRGKFQGVKDSWDWDPKVEMTAVKFQGIAVYK